MTDNQTIDSATVSDYEFCYLLRLLWYAPRMHVDGCAGLSLRNERTMQQAFLKLRPRNLTTDLTDYARADARPPCTFQDLRDYFAGEAVQRTGFVRRVLVLVNIMSAAHYNSCTSTLSDLNETLGVRLEPAAGQFDDCSPASLHHGRDFARRRVPTTQRVIAGNFSNDRSSCESNCTT
jgi:hypothetical protein